MNTSVNDNQIRNKRSKNPFDQLIFEKGLRIKHVLLDKNLNLMLVVLNNATVIKSKLSDYDRLKVATDEQLGNWSLIADGIGIKWPELNEDLSLKGFINTVYLKKTLKTLKGNQESLVV